MLYCCVTAALLAGESKQVMEQLLPELFRAVLRCLGELDSLHAYSYTPSLTRLLLHAYSYTRTLTRLLLHACYV
jgi:hypothetical protein